MTRRMPSGLGQMNLHGFLARERIHYGSPEGIDFTRIYFAAVAYHAIRASNALAREKGRSFVGFETSTLCRRVVLRQIRHPRLAAGDRPLLPLCARSSPGFGVALPTRADWEALKEAVMKDGLYNRNLQAVPPTGSISYINNSTSSIHPIVSKVEIRKEGKIGRVYYPAPFMTNDNLEYYRDAYEIGPEALIETYAAATEHVDQGLSLTLFFPAGATTRDINRAQILAWKKGIKTIYYVRLRQTALEGPRFRAACPARL